MKEETLKQENKNEYQYIGTRSIRPDGIDKVTGKANYGADYSLPGMLHGKILRSPHAHARIKSIDVSAALAIEGVLSSNNQGALELTGVHFVNTEISRKLHWATCAFWNINK